MKPFKHISTLFSLAIEPPSCHHNFTRGEASEHYTAATFTTFSGQAICEGDEAEEGIKTMRRNDWRRYVIRLWHARNAQFGRSFSLGPSCCHNFTRKWEWTGRRNNIEFDSKWWCERERVVSWCEIISKASDYRIRIVNAFVVTIERRKTYLFRV